VLQPIANIALGDRAQGGNPSKFMPRWQQELGWTTSDHRRGRGAGIPLSLRWTPRKPGGCSPFSRSRERAIATCMTLFHGEWQRLRCRNCYIEDDRLLQRLV